VKLRGPGLAVLLLSIGAVRPSLASEGAEWSLFICPIPHRVVAGGRDVTVQLRLRNSGAESRLVCVRTPFSWIGTAKGSISGGILRDMPARECTTDNERHLVGPGEVYAFQGTVRMPSQIAHGSMLRVIADLSVTCPDQAPSCSPTAARVEATRQLASRKKAVADSTGCE
jgi:hypothetical protein